MTDVLGVMEDWTESSTTIRREDGTRVVIDRSAIVSGKPVPPRPSTRLRVSARDAQLQAMSAWQPTERKHLGEWVLRAAGGFSTRVNSVLALGEPDRPWPDALAEVVAFYEQRGLPPLAQLVVGSEQHRGFVAAGWVPSRPGAGDVAFLLAGVGRTLRTMAEGSDGAARSGSRVGTRGGTDESSGSWDIRHAARASEAWETSGHVRGGDVEAMRRVLHSGREVTFVEVGPPGELVAKGRAALTDDGAWINLSDLWVRPDARRQGLARAVVRALLEWGAERGATTAFLATWAQNEEAWALYRGLGFEHHHSFCFLTPPPAE